MAFLRAAEADTFLDRTEMFPLTRGCGFTWHAVCFPPAPL